MPPLILKHEKDALLTEVKQLREENKTVMWVSVRRRSERHRTTQPTVQFNTADSSVQHSRQFSSTHPTVQFNTADSSVQHSRQFSST
ncbi:hypothetical protein ACOMHN_010156 [Nucella lapillus]